MSDRDQSDDDTADITSESGRENAARRDDADLPSFDAYGDDKNWSAFEDDESLGGDPEWTEDQSDSDAESDWTEKNPEPGSSQRDLADETDSLFDDDDFDDDNVTLGNSVSSDQDDDLDPNGTRQAEDTLSPMTDDFDDDDEGSEETYTRATPSRQTADHDDDDDDDDYYRPQPATTSRLKAKKEKKTHWAWPTSVGLLTVAVIGVAGFAWYQSGQQEQAMRSMQLKLRQAQQAPQAEAPEENEGQIQALREELDATRKLHSEEIAELEDRNQTLEAKLSSVERALKIARADAAKISNASAPPSAAASPRQSPQAASGWFINVQTYATRADADAMVARLSSSSEEFMVQAAQVNGRTLYRVRASGYATQSDAEDAAMELVDTFGLPEPWIGRDR